MLQSRTSAPRLTLFGGPELRGPAGDVVGLTPTHEALLTLLWGHEEQGLTRRRAIWLLWEDDDSARSRHRLSQVLHEVRSRLGSDPVSASGDDVLLAAVDAIPSDLADYRAALSDGALQRALAILERGFAVRLKRVPCDEYDDWIEAKRAGLRRELREIAARSWDEHQPRGAWRKARDAAEVLHALDRENESALRSVVESRAMTGGFEAAEAAFTAFVDSLPDGSAAEAETRALIERVRRLSGEREVGPPRDEAAPPPLVGRRRDLESARRMLDRVRGGAFEFLVLQGDAGIGKTRLLEEIRKEAHIKGFLCMQARSVELEQRIPLNPLIDALGHPEAGRHLRDLDDPWRAVIAALLPHLPEGMARPVVPPIAESSLSRRLYDAFSIFLTRLSEAQPTLLFLDDLQWADATTVAVLQFVQRRWRSGSLGVIGTIRPDLVAGADGVVRYLDDNEDLPVTRIVVGDLGTPQAMELVDAVAEGALDSGTIGRLCALAGGNPFYLIELTKDYVGGRLQLPEVANDALTIPISLRQLVDPRIQSLSDRAAQAASLLAIWGRWAPLSDLAALVGVPPHDLLSDVEELERQRLVVMDRDQIRIAHELIRGALYHRLSETRRALLHRAVAEHLLGNGQPQPGELAIHFGRAGDRERAARFGREAADAAMENGAMAEAAYFLQVVTENEKDERLRAEATADLASVLHMKREIARAIPVIELAAVRLRAVGNAARALRMDIHMVEGLAEIGGAPIPDLLERLSSMRSIARSSRDDEAWALVLDCELHLLHKTGDAPALARLFSELRACASSGDPRAACIANAALALTVLYGDGREALIAGRDAVRIAQAHGSTHLLLNAQNRLLVVFLHLGLAMTAEADSLLENARTLADKSGDLALKFFLESNRGVAEMDAGNLDAAAEWLRRAGAILDRAEAAYLWVSHHFNWGELALFRRDLVSAYESFHRAEQAVGTAEMPSDVSQLVSAGVGLCALELGDLAEAKRREAQISTTPREWVADPYVLLLFATRLLERRGNHAQAYQLLQRTGERLRHRFPPAWLKALLLEGHLGRRVRAPGWRERVKEGVSLAEELNFTARAATLRALLS